MAALPLDTWLRLIIWMAIGFGIYFFYGVKHSEVRKNNQENDRVIIKTLLEPRLKSLMIGIQRIKSRQKILLQADPLSYTLMPLIHRMLLLILLQ